MSNRSRRLTRPGGYQSQTRHSRSTGSRIQEGSGRSQTSQQYSIEHGLSYRTTSGNPQELDGAAFHRRQDESRPARQQNASISYAEQTPYRPPPWNTQSRSMAPGTNMFETQGNSGCQGWLHREEEMTELPGNNSLYSLHPLQNQQGFRDGSQVLETGLNMSWPQASGQANLKSFLQEISNVGTIANPEPWSLYMPNNMSHMSPEAKMNHEAYPNGISDTSPSTFGYNDSNSSHQIADDSCTHVSSYDMDGNAMDVSMLTEHPGPLNYPVAYEPVPCSSTFGSISRGLVFLSRPATPPDGRPRNDIYTSVMNNAAPSEIDRTAPLDAISDASFSAASPKIQCDAKGCGIVFSGTHRVGSLARHKRLKHRGPRPYICADPSCDRVFKRQDARLKHYRKWHETLASPYLARPQSRHAYREQYSDFASNVSG